MNEYTVIVHENGDAEIKNKTKEDSKKQKITVENNLHAPITVLVKKIEENNYTGYSIEIYDRTKHKNLAGSYIVTAIDKLVIIDSETEK